MNFQNSKWKCSCSYLEVECESNEDCCMCERVCVFMRTITHAHAARSTFRLWCHTNVMLPGGISSVSMYIYNACQIDIGFKTASGGGRHAHKESECLKSCVCVKKKRLSSTGCEMATLKGCSFSLPSS